jgi:hypothetical protein
MQERVRGIHGSRLKKRPRLSLDKRFDLENSITHFPVKEFPGTLRSRKIRA